MTIASESSTAARGGFIPSPEQQTVPGAGKTATAEAIAANDPNRPTAIITYSKWLQLGTATRLLAYPESDAFTFHGLACHLFSTTVHNDSRLRSLRRQGDVPAWTGAPYQTVILDELQDCTGDIFWLICAFISAVTYAADDKAGADTRYLSLSSTAMTALSPCQWTHMALSKRFRLSHENCAMVNKAFFGGEEYIIGSRYGLKPIYLHGNTCNADSVAKHLVPLIYKYGPEQKAILAPSVRQTPQLSKLTNYLFKAYHKPIAISIVDDIPRDDRTMIALTRARQQLVVVHDKRNDLMPFVDIESLHATAELVSVNDNETSPVPGSSGRSLQMWLLLPRNAFASDVARHILDEKLESICAKHLHIHQLQSSLPYSLYIDAPSTVVTDNAKKHHEAVSDVNGLAIVAPCEHALLAQTIWRCRKACEYEAKVSGYKSPYLQMRGHLFAWLGAYLNVARERLGAQYPESATLDFEVNMEEKGFRVINPFGGEAQTTHLRGRADIIRYETATRTPPARRMHKKKDGNTADRDPHHHAIRACIYAYLWTYKHKRPTPPRIILFNDRDGEKWDIVPPDGVASMRSVEEETLVAKYSTRCADDG
ncbi:hypothetical protein BKA63DRAFT_592679 [Paraphoma chrysanthemicola]|nr:hypothetical protein BKA63DRAFT_592679 [Paraphoma chrysanthemicola]